MIDARLKVTIVEPAGTFSVLDKELKGSVLQGKTEIQGALSYPRAKEQEDRVPSGVTL